MNQRIFKAVLDDDYKSLTTYLKELDHTKHSEVVNDLKQTPLMVATLNNKKGMVSLLLDFGFDPSQKDVNELSPFVGAAANGFDDIFELMCLYKPDPKQFNRFGGTALIPSSEKGYLSTMQKALDYGVPINHQNRLGWSALLEAVILGDGGYLYQDIIRELLVHGADTSQRDFEDKSSLDYAKQNNQEDIEMMMTAVVDDEFTLIRSLIRKSHYTDALFELLKMETSNQQVFYLGMIYEALNDDAAAEYYYKSGLENDIQFAFYLAQLYRKQNKVEKAIEAFNIGSNNEYLQYHLSNYLRELNRHEEAINVMDSLLKNNPKRVDYMFHKANSLRTLNQHKKAYEEMVKAYEIMPNNELFREHSEQSLSLMKEKRG